MDFIEKIKKQAKQDKKKMILPETMDERVLKAAEIIIKEEIADLILIGNQEDIVNKHPSLEQAEFVNPKEEILIENYAKKLANLRGHKGMTEEEAKNLLKNDWMYLACMLLLDQKAHGIVSGVCHSSSSTLRPALQIIKTKPNINLVSSFFLMDIPNFGLYVFADCGLVQYPNSNELAEIAVASSKSYQYLVEEEPYVALLSHSTKGSATHEEIDKVVETLKIVKEHEPNLKIDGELQLDAAIIPEIAKIKAPTSNVAGKANVLVFPNIDSGNIGYKLVERFARAKAYGPITQGLLYPINDLSRGCSVEDIVGVVAITCVQAQNNN